MNGTTGTLLQLLLLTGSLILGSIAAAFGIASVVASEHFRSPGDVQLCALIVGGMAGVLFIAFLGTL